jgi:hypothetical protein
MLENLNSLRDDMTAFIEGHGMRRFPGYITEEVASVTWDAAENPDSWKDFVELAKAAGATFLTMNEVTLDKEELDFLIERLRQAPRSGSEDIEEARLLRTYTGKTGFVQLGWPYQGVMFLFEVSTEWYERYQRLMDFAEEMGSLMVEEDETDEDED